MHTFEFIFLTFAIGCIELTFVLFLIPYQIGEEDNDDGEDEREVEILLLGGAVRLAHLPSLSFLLID